MKAGPEKLPDPDAIRPGDGPPASGQPTTEMERAMFEDNGSALLKTSLHAPHLELGARLVHFASIPVFGIGAYFSKPSDFTRAHGLNERIGVLEFHESIAFWYQLFKTLAH